MTIRAQSNHQPILVMKPSFGTLRGITYQPSCSCGWKGKVSFDRKEANDERMEHARANV